MALVLSRKSQQQIVIGEPGPDQIVIQVQRFERGRVQIGIIAGKHIPIRRGEVPRVDPGDRE